MDLFLFTLFPFKERALDEILQESSDSIPDQHEVGDHALSKQPASPTHQPDQTSETAETSQTDQSADVPDPEVLPQATIVQEVFSPFIPLHNNLLF